MRLTKLTVKNFRKFKEKTFEFAEGVNIVQGLNEAGKSTLSEAILALFFADPTTKSKQFFDKYGSWDNEGSIFLQGEGTSPMGKFQLTKNFGLRLAKLANLDTKKETVDVGSVEKSVGQLLGIKSGKVFESTAYVRQSDITRIESSEDLIAAVQNAASAGGAEGGTSGVIKEIDKELLELKKGLDRPTNNPGKLKELEIKIAQTAQNLANMREKWEKVRNAASAEKSSKGELEGVREKISIAEKQIEYNKMYKEALQKIKEIEQQTLRLERKFGEVKEVSIQISNINTKLEEFKSLASYDLEKTAKEITELSSSIKIKKETLKKLQETPGEKVEEEKKSQGGNSSRFILPGAGIVLTILLYLFLKRVDVLLLGLGISIITAAYVFFASQKKEDNKAEKQEQETKSRQVAELEEQIQKDEEELNKILDQMKVKNADDFHIKKAKMRGFLEEKANLESLQKGMLEGRTIDEMKDEQNKLFAKKKEIEVNELTEDVKNSNLSSEEYLRKRRELDTLKMEERRLAQVETASKVRVEDAEVSIDNIVETEEELERLSEEFEYYKKKRRVLELVRQTVELAVEDTAKDAGKLIKDFVKIYLPKLTQERYSEVRVGKDLSIQVFSKEKNDWIDPVSILSNGTVDQIYFLTRLAILDLVAKDSKPPIILDDPFVTFDKGRKQMTKEILTEVAQKHQVILLTHHDEYSDWGHVITLK